MHYHSKGYQQRLQGWPTDVRLRTTSISCMYESLNHEFMHITTYICGLNMPEYVSTLEKNPTFVAKESALIRLER
jgi:hypothetical protein